MKLYGFAGAPSPWFSISILPPSCDITSSMLKLAAFTKAGHFVAAYRALFGEAPAATLMRNSAESA